MQCIVCICYLGKLDINGLTLKPNLRVKLIVLFHLGAWQTYLLIEDNLSRLVLGATQKTIEYFNFPF